MRCPICGEDHASCMGLIRSNSKPVEIPAIPSMAKNDYIATERLYLNKEGNVVGAKDPSKETLLVAAGGVLPEATARKCGLIKDEEPEPDAPPDPLPPGDPKPEGGQGEGGEEPPPEGDKTPEGGDADNPQTEVGKKPEGKPKPRNNR